MVRPVNGSLYDCPIVNETIGSNPFENGSKERNWTYGSTHLCAYTPPYDHVTNEGRSAAYPDEYLRYGEMAERCSKV